MRRTAIATGSVLGVALLVLAPIPLLGELGSEVVTIRTRDAGGEPVETRLWIVDDAGAAWLRAGSDGFSWLGRIEADRVIELERGGRSLRVRAVPVREPVVRDRIHARMREKYGWLDAWIGLVRDEAASVPIRIDPL